MKVELDNRELSNDFCFIFNRKNVISHYLFCNVSHKNNTCFLRGKIKFKRDIISKIYNRYLYRLFRFSCSTRKFKDKIVLLTSETLSCISDKKLKNIKKYSKAIVLFFIDEFFNDYKSISKAKEIVCRDKAFFDLIYTFSPKDAENQSLKLNYSYYSEFKDLKLSRQRSDIFFVGHLKNRDILLNQLAEYFSSNDVNLKCFVSTSKQNRTNNLFNYRLIPYTENIEFINRTNCVLDICDERQTGMTLRYYEAVVYNKKLLTNNPNIVNMPYYDARYMKIYKTLEDIKEIDINWFKNIDNIDYGYKGEFEPEHFLHCIISELGKIN